MEKLFQLARGYVKLHLCSESPERFLNLCRNHGIVLWNLSSEQGYFCCTSIDDFYRMHPLVRKSHIKVKIQQKRGFPFWMQRNRKKIPFFLGFVCFMILLQIASLFIWKISYEGNQKHTTDELSRFLQERGYVSGMRIKNAQCEELEKEIRRYYSDINWVSVMIEGTKMTVKVKENDGYLDAQMEDDSPCSLYAKYSGVIRGMITRAGVPKVKVGDEVEAGQLLVSGVVPVLNEDEGVIAEHQVHASADIYVEQVISYSDWISDGYLQRNITKTFSFPFIQLGTYYIKIPDFLWKEKENKMSVTRISQVCIQDSLWLPIYYGVENVSAYTETILKKTENEMEKEAAKKISDYLENLQKIGVEIIQNNVTINLIAGGCLAEGDIIAWYPCAEAGELMKPAE